MAGIFAPLQGHFDGGELSPMVYGRVDAPNYKSGLALCRNWMPTLQGALVRRPGTYYINNVKDSATNTRLIPFVFSVDDALVIEVNDSGSMRFYTNGGFVETTAGSGTPYELTTPFGPTASCTDLRWVQSNDVLYLVHPALLPMKLSRYADNNWELITMTFIDGPYDSINATVITLTASATTGTVQVDAGPNQSITAIVSFAPSSGGTPGSLVLTVPSHGWTESMAFQTEGILGTDISGLNAYFPATNVTIVDANTIEVTADDMAGTDLSLSGATITPAPFSPVLNLSYPMRMEIGGNWGTGVVTENNGSYASVTVTNTLPGTTATTDWELGFWRDIAGTGNPNFPSVIGFHQDRLCFAGASQSPSRIDMSTVSDYQNFSPSGLDGTVTDSNACSFTLNSENADGIQWMVTDWIGLLLGTEGAEWSMQPGTTGGAITPESVNAVRETAWGSNAIAAMGVGKATICVQRDGRHVRELMYFWDVSGYRSTDLTELADHIVGPGIGYISYQRAYFPQVWFLRTDGVLIGLVYDRNAMQLRVGWHQHQLGGQSDAGGTPPIVESICTIPDSSTGYDDLYMVVQRWINGAVVRTIEYLTPVFRETDLQQDAFFLDCGLTYDNPVFVDAITTGSSTVTVTADNHGFSTGDTVRFDGVVGVLVEAGGASALNGLTFEVTVGDENTFTLDGVDGTNFTSFVPPATSASPNSPQVRALVSAISGLTYLEGETVSIYADGAYQTPQVVSSGSVSLQTPAAVVSVGYEYNSDGQMLRLEAGARNGTSFGKKRRTHRVGLMLYRSQGFQLGKSFENLDPVQFRTQGVSLQGEAPALFSGIASHTTDFDYDYDNDICFRVSGPWPCTLQAVMPMLETEDRD